MAWYEKTKEQGPDFQKILKQSYDNVRIFVQYTLILRQIYDNRTNTLNIVNMTKYINVNIKNFIIYVISRNNQQVCNALQLDNLMDNNIIQTRRF